MGAGAQEEHEQVRPDAQQPREGVAHQCRAPDPVVTHSALNESIPSAGHEPGTMTCPYQVPAPCSDVEGTRRALGESKERSPSRVDGHRSFSARGLPKLSFKGGTGQAEWGAGLVGAP